MSNMRESFVLIILLLFAGTGAAQKHATVFSLKINKKLPSIYLLKGKSSSEAIGRLALKLHNNLRVGIQIKVSSESGKKGDLLLYFDIIDDSGVVVQSNPCHICSTVVIPADSSVNISLPLPLPKNAFALRFDFAYEWEVADPILASREPIHYAVWRFTDL